jgi:hypothetical protein
MKKMMLAGAMLAALVIGAGSASAVTLTGGKKTQNLTITGKVAPNCAVGNVKNVNFTAKSAANQVAPASFNLTCNFTLANVSWSVTPAKGAIATGKTSAALGESVNYVYQVQSKVGSAAATTLSDYPKGQTKTSVTPRTGSKLDLKANTATQFIVNVKLTEGFAKKPAGTYTEALKVVIG